MPEERLRYLPQLDGLRAICVTAVIAYHSNVPAMKGGYIGVDVFFVLSGYLITTLLVREFDSSNRIALRGFYVRRARRLLPGLVAACAFAALVSVFYGDDVRGPTLLGVPASLLYLSAWVRAFGVSNLGALGHTWSLSVEEHFYLVWPPIALVILKYRRKSFVVCIAALTGFAMCYHMGGVLLKWSVDRVYNAPDTRAQDLMVGCLLAALADRWGPMLSRPIVRYCAVGSGFFLAIWCIYIDYNSRFYRVGGPVVVLAAGVIIASLSSDVRTRTVELLSTSWIAWIGRRSYGLYLFHFPLAVLIGYFKWEWTLAFTATLCMSIVLADVSFRWVESPFLAKSRMAVVPDLPQGPATVA